jgi:YHS domain-containing protein
MAAMMRQKRKQNLTISVAANAIFVAMAIFAPLPAAAAALVQTIVTDPLSGVALEGYDPVSYFTEPEPLMGVPDYEYLWQGVPWYFATPANRDVFITNPEIYAPQFGGHCLMSLSRGFLSDGKPRLYLIQHMKLYLFYSVANREAFLSAESVAMSSAYANWQEFAPGLTAEEPSFADAVADRGGEAGAPVNSEASAHAEAHEEAPAH